MQPEAINSVFDQLLTAPRHDTFALCSCRKPVSSGRSSITLVDYRKPNCTYDSSASFDTQRQASAEPNLLALFCDEVSRRFDIRRQVNPRQPLPEMIPVTINGLE